MILNAKLYHMYLEEFLFNHEQIVSLTHKLRWVYTILLLLTVETLIHLHPSSTIRGGDLRLELSGSWNISNNLSLFCKRFRYPKDSILS